MRRIPGERSPVLPRGSSRTGTPNQTHPGLKHTPRGQRICPRGATVRECGVQHRECELDHDAKSQPAHASVGSVTLDRQGDSLALEGQGSSTRGVGPVRRCAGLSLSARVTPEAQAIAQVDNAISAANVPEVRADLDSPLSLMLGECQAPGVLDGLDHVPLNGVVTAPHAGDSLPGRRIVERVRDDLEALNASLDALALRN